MIHSSTSIDYFMYVHSVPWMVRRDTYFIGRAKTCARCRDPHKKPIELHHLSYEQLGHEPDEDLMPLCRHCHNYIHRMVKMTGKGLREMTLQLVAA